MTTFEVEDLPAQRRRAGHRSITGEKILVGHLGDHVGEYSARDEVRETVGVRAIREHDEPVTAGPHSTGAATDDALQLREADLRVIAQQGGGDIHEELHLATAAPKDQRRVAAGDL